MKHLAVSVVIMTLFIGCASLQPQETLLLQQSRFGELRQLMEGRIEDPAAAPFSELFYLCYAYSKVKDYRNLFPCVDTLQQDIDQGDYKLFVFDFKAAPALMKAQAFMELGDLEKALGEAQIAYRLTDTNKAYKQMRIYAVTAVGLISALLKDSVQAERFARELEAISTHYPDTLLATDKYVGLAKIYMAMADYPRALAALREDEKTRGFKAAVDLITGSSLAGESLFTYWELPKQYMRNRCLLETGDVPGAKEGYERLLQMPQTEQNGDIFWLILFDRARIARQEGQWEAAVDYCRRAIEIVEMQRATISTEANKIGFVADKQAVYRLIISLLFSQSRYAEAFEYVERSKARALVDMLASRSQFGDRAKDLVTRLDAAEYQAGLQDVAVTAEQLDRQRGLVAALREEIRATDPELASLVAVTPLNVDEIRQLLPPSETVVAYFIAGDTLYTFVLDRGGVNGFKQPAGELRRSVAEFREAIMASDAELCRREGRSLFDRLIRPVEKMIATDKLTIVPHGALHYVPFNALYTGGEYLLDRFYVRVLPSASVLKFLKSRREGHAGQMLALGNPDLGNPAYDLPWAQREASAIAEGQAASRLLVREKATETAVKRLGEQFRYVHFATHGTFYPETPLASALLLAKDGENEGALTAGEIYTLNLPADLVTLSACETALGKVADGDEVVGLTRGFLYAGAGAIVSSLWKVEDRATSVLMQAFYSSLPNMDKRSALRAAQLKVKESYNSLPFFWAAFQITGTVD